MTLPDKTRYSITDLAKELMVTEDLIEEYLDSRKLFASIKIPFTQLVLVNDFADFSEYNDICESDEFGTKDNVIDIDIDWYEGIFLITRYNRIRWDTDDSCDFMSNEVHICDHSNWHDLIIFRFAESYAVKRSEIFIEKSSIDKFLKECDFDLTHPVQLSPLQRNIKQVDTPLYTDNRHPYFSKELETAISAWIAIYGSNSFNHKKGHTKQITDWIKKNRKEKYGLTESAIRRISQLVNINIKGGVPSSDTYE